jgi:hypothetical protein
MFFFFISTFDSIPHPPMSNQFRLPVIFHPPVLKLFWVDRWRVGGCRGDRFIVEGKGINKRKRVPTATLSPLSYSFPFENKKKS